MYHQICSYQLICQRNLQGNPMSCLERETVIRPLHNEAEIAVSIVNYNSTSHLLDCLRSIKDHSGHKHIQILITDNASRDLEPERIYQIFPDAFITINRENKGFAFAQNQNFALSKANYFFLLNPDTVITENLFQPILDTFESMPHVAIVSPNIVSPNGESLLTILNLPTLGSALWNLTYFDSLFASSTSPPFFGDLSQHKYVDCITGAAFAVRSEIYRALGGLDEAFFMYFEEVDFCKRMKATFHHEIVVLPQIKLFHLFGRSSAQTEVRHTVYYESYYLYFRKHQGAFASLAVRLFIIFNTIARVIGLQIKYFPLTRSWKQYSRKTLAAFRLLFWALGLRKTSRGSYE